MRKTLLLLAFAGFLGTNLPAEQMMFRQEQADVLFKQLVAASASHDYDSFVAPGTIELKAALSKTQFEASCDILAPRLKTGYDLTPLGEVDEKGYQVFLYRLRFKNGGDDILGTMSLKNGQVGGILFH
jgi:hypothetical protein